LDPDWLEKQVSISDYAIDQNGILNIDFQLSATMTGGDSDLADLVGSDLTSTDLAVIRGLVREIALHRQLLESHSPIGELKTNGAEAMKSS
jgi:replicative DNA helicase